MDASPIVVSFTSTPGGWPMWLLESRFLQEGRTLLTFKLNFCSEAVALDGECEEFVVCTERGESELSLFHGQLPLSVPCLRMVTEDGDPVIARGLHDQASG